MSSRHAIAILSFDRPEYLLQVIHSIQVSINFLNRDVDIYLFQDGNYNPISHLNKCSDAMIKHCVSVFQKAFPNGTIMLSPINLGVALNVFRAEEFLLIRQKYTSAMVFEDDMVLHPYYLRVLSDMLDQAERDIRIGQVACYGTEHQLTIDEQLMSKDQINHLAQNWGYGVTREFYSRRRQIDRQYIDLIVDVDYSEKDFVGAKIQELHESMGFRRGVISQDMFKAMSTASIGGLRFNTRAVLGRYIGEDGLHSTREDFMRAGFDRTLLYPIDGPLPSPMLEIDSVYDSELERQKKLIDFMNSGIPS